MEKFNLEELNNQLMPTALDIKQKMEMLQKRFNLPISDFAFKELTMEEIIQPQEQKEP